MGYKEDIKTIADILKVREQINPHGTALLEMDRQGRLHGTTYRKLKGQVDALCVQLQERSVRRGDRVALLMPNCKGWIVAYFAAQALGAVAVPLEYEFLEHSPDVIQFEFEHAGPTLVIAQAGDMDAISRLTGDGDIVMSVPQGGPDAAAGEFVAPEPPRPSDLAQILYTSGTTGPHKGVGLTHENVMFNVRKSAERFRIGRSDCVPALLPYHHSFPLTTTVVLPLYGGAHIAVGDIKKRESRQLIPACRPTVLVGVPRLFESVLDGIETAAARQGKLEKLQKTMNLVGKIKRYAGLNVGKLLFRSLHKRLFGGMQLRFCLSGGAKLSVEVARKYFTLGIPLQQGWGMTELSPVGTAQPFSKWRFYFTRYYEEHVGSIGTPLDGTEILLADLPEQGIRVSETGAGEMVVRGPHVMHGYHNDPAETERRKSPEGLKTGDIARRDRQGNLFIVGRAKHVIVLPSGKKVFPEEDLYEELSGCAAIEEFAVRAIGDETRGERIGIIIKPSLDFIAASGVSSLGELYEAIRKEINAALSLKPDYMRTFDFCLTEYEGTEFKDLIKSTTAETCPLKNPFCHERSYTANRDSAEPLPYPFTAEITETAENPDNHVPAGGFHASEL